MTFFDPSTARVSVPKYASNRLVVGLASSEMERPILKLCVVLAVNPSESIVNEKVGMPEFNAALDRSNWGREAPVVSSTPSLPRVAVTLKSGALAAVSEMVN